MRDYLINSTDKADIIHWDWISVVFTFDSSDFQKVTNASDKRELILKWLSKKLHFTDEWAQGSSGIYSYDSTLLTANNSIVVGFNKDPNSKDTFLLQMSGTGVEHLETILNNQGFTIDDFLIDFCANVPVDEFHFTRLDPCRNFFNYDYHLSAMYAYRQIKLGNLISKSRFVKGIHSFSSDGALPTKKAYTSSEEGFTTYIGKNPKQLRIYNKLAERRAKLSKYYNLKSWSRWEFELSGIHAQNFYELYLKVGLKKAWVDYCSDYIRFITKAGQKKRKRKSRYPTATWYASIVQNADEITLRKPGQKPTLERTNKWLTKVVSTPLANIVKAREIKYIENGFNYVEASRLAREKVINDLINDKLDDEDFDMSIPVSWAQEHWSDIV